MSCLARMRACRSSSSSTITYARGVAKATGTLFAGRTWSRIVTPGTAIYVINVEIGANGTVTIVTDAPMASRFPVNIVANLALTWECFEGEV